MSNGEQVNVVNNVFSDIRDHIELHEIDSKASKGFGMSCTDITINKENSKTFVRFFDVVETNIRYNH